MNLEIKKVKLSDKAVRRIYVDSFPKAERMPFPMMVLMTKITHTDFLSFYDGDTLCGFIYLAAIESITFIMFLAVDKDLRSKGYDSEILKAVQSLYPNNKIIISIERCDVEAANINDRIRRKKFYLKNGYTDTGYLIELSKVEQEIIIKNGTFDQDEFYNFFVKYSNGTIKPKIWKSKI